MRRLIIVAALVGASLTLLLIVADRAESTNGVTGIGRFRETQISGTTIGIGAGAVEVWRTRVYTYRGQTVGTGALTCIYVDNHTSFRQCTGTYLLPLGKIIVAGNIISRGAIELAVVQGTRFYAGSHGTAIFRLYAKQPAQSFVTFYLVSD